MKYYFKVYKWANGHNEVDLTEKMAVPVYINEKLNETLDTGLIILDLIEENGILGLGAVAMPAKTKIRIECYDTDPALDNTALPVKTWDMVIEDDEVEEYQYVS